MFLKHFFFPVFVYIVLNLALSICYRTLPSIVRASHRATTVLQSPSTPAQDYTFPNIQSDAPDSGIDEGPDPRLQGSHCIRCTETKLKDKVYKLALIHTFIHHSKYFIFHSICWLLDVHTILQWMLSTMFSVHITWKHIQKVKTTVPKIIGVMYRIKSFVPKSVSLSLNIKLLSYLVLLSGLINAYKSIFSK